MAIQGGPAMSVSVVSSPARHAGGAAIPVAVVTDGRDVVAGPAQRVIVVPAPPHIQGGPVIPVVAAPAGAIVAGGPALRVYVVPGGGILDTLAYTNKINALGPITHWSMAEPSGSVAQDASGNGRVGAYTGVTLGVTGIGDGLTAASFDGATSFNNVYSASLAAAFNGQQGSLIVWGRVSAAGIWTDGIARRQILFQVDANNRVGINKAVASNELDWLYVAGGVSKTAGVTSFSPTGFFCAGLTWDKAGDAVKFYIGGNQSGVTATGLGVFAGSLSSTQTIIGSLSTAPAQVWSGTLAHAAVFNRALSAAEMLSASTL